MEMSQMSSTASPVSSGNNSSKIEAVIFDIDGVLVETEASRFKYLQELSRRLNLGIEDNDYGKMIGKTTKDFLVNFKGIQPDVFQNDIWPIFEREYLSNVTKFMVPISTCLDFIKQTPKTKKYAVASNNLYDVIKKIIGGLGIEEYIDVIVSREDVQNPKPNPDIYIMATKKLQIAHDQCICIEDSPIGAKAANDANVPCHIFLNGSNSQSQFLNLSVSSFFKTIDELTKIIYG